MPKTLLKTESFLEKWTFCCLLVFLASLSFSNALTEISFGAALGGWALLRFKRPQPFIFEPKMFAALVLFVTLSILSFFWSEFPKQSFRGIFKILQNFFLFWMTAETLVQRQRLNSATRLVVLLLMGLGLDGMWQYVWGSDLLRQIPYESASSGPRISASFKNYGLLASFVLSFLAIPISQLEKKEGPFASFLSALAVAFGLLLLFWTRLRGAWVAFIGGIVFYLFLERKRLMALLFLGGIVLGAFVFLPRSMLIHLDAQGKEQSLVERFYLWDRAIHVITARPWTGTGINTYAVAHQKYDQRQNWRVKNYYAHNGYLQVAAETGLPSLLCFLAFLFLYFRRGIRFLAAHWNQRKPLTGILVGMGSFLILGLIDTVFHNPQAMMGFWFLAGWGVAYQTVYESER